MCGIAGWAGHLQPTHRNRIVGTMMRSLSHRGPDGEGLESLEAVTLGHRRLSIVDLSELGAQPMRRGPWSLIFNGEIYNHVELRRDLMAHGVRFRSRCDSEVLLAAWSTWGPSCLDRLQGMWAFAIWNEDERQLVLVRDRFGVKPLYFVEHPRAPDGTRCHGDLAFASEIGSLQAVGLGREPVPEQWARFLTDGASESPHGTFWRHIERLGAGELATWSPNQGLRRRTWYDIDARTREVDTRTDSTVLEELRSALEEAVALRCRADVPIGINLSGGLDSSLLLAFTARQSERDPTQIHAFTFATNDARYDETPWVESMLHQDRHRQHPHHVVTLAHGEVPALAERVARHQSEPAGGLPTLAYTKLMQHARDLGFKVLLDGQGVDESWAGYDTYRRPPAAATPAAMVQGSVQGATRPQAIAAELCPTTLGKDSTTPPAAPPPQAGCRLRRLQLDDIQLRKLPRALRYNDRVSMLASIELREPFLDHRLVELGLRQPAQRKVDGTTGKVLPRRLARQLLPRQLSLAPKRPLQTPQREWLRGPLRDWAQSHIDTAVGTGWLRPEVVDLEWQTFLSGQCDNSFFVWQWIDLALTVAGPESRP